MIVSGNAIEGGPNQNTGPTQVPAVVRDGVEHTVLPGEPLVEDSAVKPAKKGNSDLNYMPPPAPRK